MNEDAFTLTWMDRRGAGRSVCSTEASVIEKRLKTIKTEAAVRNHAGTHIGGVFWNDEKRCWAWWIDPDGLSHA